MTPGKPPLNLREALRLRPGNQYDMSFVRSSWFESYLRGGCAPQTPFYIFKAAQDQIMRQILQTAEVQIAYPHGMPPGDDSICGWICYSGPVVHYVYTKLIYRQKGIAKDLITGFVPATPRQHTHETLVGRSLASKLTSQFNPYLLYNLDPLKRLNIK